MISIMLLDPNHVNIPKIKELQLPILGLFRYTLPFTEICFEEFYVCNWKNVKSNPDRSHWEAMGDCTSFPISGELMGWQYLPFNNNTYKDLE